MPLSHRVYSPRPGLAFRLIDGQVVIVHPQENRLLTLNKAASLLWQALDGRPSEQLVAVLEERYPEQSTERLQEDVEQFITDMLARELLVEGDGA